MKIAKIIIAFILALLMFFGASGHIMNPEMSNDFIPDFLPKATIHVLTAIVEISLGILTLIPKTRYYGLIGILLLLIAFLPIHVIDYLQTSPVIGSKNAALVRILMQLVFIFLAWFASLGTRKIRLPGNND
ncbi:hypothetical protein [Portibacter marinus]|uniref:hypothetical protein n=1 Tax=Portibacter marinus TaxID=2898660 RepID=UPI001F2822BD|nr:hypothetical protein [Portibacter marinus]